MNMNDTTAPMIGVIADDVTGGTDVAIGLSRQGLHTALFFGIPTDAAPTGHDAVVLALKTRTIAVEDAVAQSRQAAAWLRAAGATMIYFKYCSTFDSTEHGNIGPVFDALADDLGARLVVTTPSSPEHGRTQYGGQLFVDGVPLAESHMRHHPLTPMTDSSLVRLLGSQTTDGVAVVQHRTITAGSAAITRALADTEARYVLPDAISDDDLLRVGREVLQLPLTGGAAGLAGGIAAALREDRGLDEYPKSDVLPGGRAVVLSGSCSARTLEQVAAFQAAGRPSLRLDVLATPDVRELAESALNWFDSLPSGYAPMIYSTMPAHELRRTQQQLGVARSAALIEEAVGLIARGLRDRGVTRFVAAGGETSGAVVAALGVAGGTVGPEADRGVPWIETSDGLALLLKSGNFGEVDLLLRASAEEVGAPR